MPLAARGLGHILRTPTLWPWVAAPAVVFGVLGLAALWFGWGQADRLVGWILGPPGGGGLRASVRAILLLLSHVAFALGGLVGAWYATAALTGPFHDRLSVLVERAELGSAADEPFTLALLVSDIATGVIHAIAALTLWAAAACLLLPLQIIPIVGEVLYFVLGATLSASMLAWQSLDYPLSRRRLRFGTKLALMRSEGGATLGLGLGTLLLLAVPVVNLLAMPAAVVGATRLVCGWSREGLMPDGRP